jgi:hypothetical protein
MMATDGPVGGSGYRGPRKPPDQPPGPIARNAAKFEPGVTSLAGEARNQPVTGAVR